MFRSHRRVSRKVREAPGSPGGLLCTINGRHNVRRYNRKNCRHNDGFNTKPKTCHSTSRIKPNYENFTLNRKNSGMRDNFEDPEEQNLSKIFKNFCHVKKSCADFPDLWTVTKSEDSEELILCEFFKKFCRVKNLQ